MALGYVCSGSVLFFEECAILSKNDSEGPQDSESLQRAIERLHPRLPDILGKDSSAFLVELDARLVNGGDDQLDQLRELFSRYPAANQRLHETIDFATKESEAKTRRGGLGLYGVPQVSPSFSYRCY